MLLVAPVAHSPQAPAAFNCKMPTASSFSSPDPRSASKPRRPSAPSPLRCNDLRQEAPHSVAPQSRHIRPILIPLLDEAHPAQAGLIVIAPLVGSFRQLDLAARQFLVGDRLEKMGDDIEPGAAFVVGADQPPWRMLGVGRLEHH